MDVDIRPADSGAEVDDNRDSGVPKEEEFSFDGLPEIGDTGLGFDLLEATNQLLLDETEIKQALDECLGESSDDLPVLDDEEIYEELEKYLEETAGAESVRKGTEGVPPPSLLWLDSEIV